MQTRERESNNKREQVRESWSTQKRKRASRESEREREGWSETGNV